MADKLPVMYAAVIGAVGVAFLASGPAMRLVGESPTVVMPVLAFLLMIGVVLIADGFGHDVTQG